VPSEEKKDGGGNDGGEGNLGFGKKGKNQEETAGKGERDGAITEGRVQ